MQNTFSNKQVFIYFGSIITSTVLFFLIVYLLFFDIRAQNLSDLKYENGFPIVHIFAKNGYSPNYIEVPANTPFILRVETNSTYDCTGSLNIASLGISTLLKPTDIRDFTIMGQPKGSSIRGSCGMAMYGFEIKLV